MNAKRLMTEAAQACLRGDPNAVEMAQKALLAIENTRVNAPQLSGKPMRVNGNLYTPTPSREDI